VTSLEPPQNQEIIADGSVFSYFWITWFRTVWSILGYQNCRTEEFIPDTTGITLGGVNTTTANYNVFRNRFSFSVDIEDTVSIVGSAGSTIDLKNLNRFTLIPMGNGHCVVSDTNINQVLTVGVINDGIAYLPFFNVVSATAKINISGFYLIEETK
jgi:hypothetical protein